MEDDLSVTSDDLVFIRISVPELSVEKCLQFGRQELVWDVKQQCLSSLPKELKESFNYGLFYPPQNGRAGKFLDEARPIADYPFPEPVGYLELKYKRRVYKMLKLDERQLKAAHSRANLRRLLDHVTAGHADKVAKLLAKGLDPNFHCGETGETPLTLTAKLKEPKRMILTLVNGGAIVDYRTLEGATALHKAVERNNFEALKTLLDLGASPNYQDAKGLTPLYHSILFNSDPALSRALLHDHATTGAQDAQGWTEVHQAARRSMTQHLEHLLFYGAEMNARNASGNTPLHVCAINGEEACARVLLFRGADREALNFANQTPHQVAVIAGNMELADVISRHQPEDVVPFKEAPQYNPRRRSGIVLPRTHSESRLGSPLSKPPSPSPSNRSLPPFSSASSLSEASTGSSGTCTQPLADSDPVGLHGKDLFDAVSESSGVGTSNGSGSGDSCDAHPEATLALAGSGATAVCTEAYSGGPPGHLSLLPGDIVEVSASTDHGLLEGCVAGRMGLFPARCVQEVRLRKPPLAAVPPVSAEPLYAARPPPFGCSQYGTAPRPRVRPPQPQPRTVVLHRSSKGFGFVLRGAKATSPLMELHPSERCPALQYLDDVDPGGVAERAGLCKWDFILAINGVDVSQASHELVVEHIRRAGDLVEMTVVSLPDSIAIEQTARTFSTLPRKLSGACGGGGRPPIPPLPPKRDPKTTLSVGRARARSMLNNFPELEALDRAIHDYDSEGRSTNSSSLDSETYKVPSVKVASIRSRPCSARLTPRELEEMFARQGTAPRYPPTAGQGGPRVYASVAEMKRHKGKKPKGAAVPVDSVFVGDSGSLRKDFLSTPDLQTMLGGAGERRSHSQEDLHALRYGPGARLGPQPAWGSTERLWGRGRRLSGAETGSETSQEPSLRGGFRRPRHLKNKDASRGRGRSSRAGSEESEYAVPPVVGDGSARRVPSTFRPTADAKLYASPTELRTLAFHDGSESQSTLRRRLQARSRSVPPPSRTTGADPTASEPATPTATTASGDDTTPTNTPTSADLAQLYAQPLRRQLSQPLQQLQPTPDEELPPPPPALLLPAASPGGGESTLQTLLAEKLAERQRRLSLGEASPQHHPHQQQLQQQQTGEEAQRSAEAEQQDSDQVDVEQVTRIKVGKKPQPTASGIPSPKAKTPPTTPIQGMTKSHTIGSLSGDDLKAARSKLRTNSKLPTPSSAASAAAGEAEEGDNSSSGVSSDQDQAQPKYVTFIPTEGSAFARRQEESEESEESSDDTSDRTWILSSERGRPGAAAGGGRQPRPAAAETRRASSIPCLATARGGRAQTPSSGIPSSLSQKTRPVSITVPSGRPARENKQLRFGGTTTVVITGGSSSPEPESEPVEASIERSLQQIERNARQLGSSASGPVPVVPPPPEFDGVPVLPPPPEFSDPTGGGEAAKKTAPRPPPKPGADGGGGSRLVKPRTLALGLKSCSSVSPGSTSPSSPTAPTAGSSPAGAASPAAVTSPRASGIPRLGSGPAVRKPSAGSPSKIPGALKAARPSSGGAAAQHVKNRFRSTPVPHWTVEDTCDWLESLFMSEHKARFSDAGVDGPRLLQLDGAALIELGVKRMGHRMNIDKSLKRHTVQARSPARQS